MICPSWTSATRNRSGGPELVPVADAVDVRDDAVAFLDERADRHLAVGEQTDPHPFERLVASMAAGDLPVLVGEALPVDLGRQQRSELVEPSLRHGRERGRHGPHRGSRLRGRAGADRVVARRGGRVGLFECLQQLLRFVLLVVLGPSGRGGVIAGVVEVRVSAVVEQQPDHGQVPAHRGLVQRRGPRPRVDVEPQLDQQRDRVIAVLLGRADQLIGAPLDRAPAQAGIARQQPLHGRAVAGHRGRDQLVDLIVLPGRARVDQ